MGGEPVKGRERAPAYIAGKPVLVLETSYARSISAAGNSMVNYVLALMGGVLGITGLAILLMLNRTVLKPVARLMDRVLEARGVAERPRIEPDAKDGAPDEIAILGAEFERTLAQLEKPEPAGRAELLHRRRRAGRRHDPQCPQRPDAYFDQAVAYRPGARHGASRQDGGGGGQGRRSSGGPAGLRTGGDVSEGLHGASAD